MVWHYHRNCQRAYEWYYQIEPGDLCPKCWKPFELPFFQYTCEGCETVYYSDQAYKLGDIITCPIHGEPIAFTKEMLTVLASPPLPSSPPPPPPPPVGLMDDWATRLLFGFILGAFALGGFVLWKGLVLLWRVTAILSSQLLQGILFTWFWLDVTWRKVAIASSIAGAAIGIWQLVLWLPILIELATPTFAALGTLISGGISMLPQLLYMLAVGAAMVATPIIVLGLLHLATRPSHESDNRGISQPPSPFLEWLAKRVKDKMGQTVPPDRAARYTTSASGNAGQQAAAIISDSTSHQQLAKHDNRVVWNSTQKQQIVIGLLVLGLAISLLFCYLAIETVGQARQTLSQAASLGTLNIFFFAIIFYGSKYFLDLDQRLADKSTFYKNTVKAGMFGTATVLTLIFVPRILGEDVTGPIIAIELLINVVVDLFLTFYEKILNWNWRQFGRNWRLTQG